MSGAGASAWDGEEFVVSHPFRCRLRGLRKGWGTRGGPLPGLRIETWGTRIRRGSLPGLRIETGGTHSNWAAVKVGETEIAVKLEPLGQSVTGGGIECARQAAYSTMSWRRPITAGPTGPTETLSSSTRL
jgi:hypothetical protein